MSVQPYLLFRFWYLACFLGATWATCTSCTREDAGGDNGDIVFVGQSLPCFCVRMSDGTSVSPATLAGQTAVIVFFSTECPDCREEFPVLQQLYQEYAATVAFVCIGRDETSDVVADYWEKHNLSLPYSPQQDREVYNRFALHTIPRIYVVDANGLVQAVFAGKVSLQSLQSVIETAGRV